MLKLNKLTSMWSSNGQTLNILYEQTTFAQDSNGYFPDKWVRLGSGKRK